MRWKKSRETLEAEGQLALFLQKTDLRNNRKLVLTERCRTLQWDHQARKSDNNERTEKDGTS